MQRVLQVPSYLTLQGSVKEVYLSLVSRGAPLGWQCAIALTTELLLCQTSGDQFFVYSVFPVSTQVLGLLRLFAYIARAENIQDFSLNR